MLHLNFTLSRYQIGLFLEMEMDFISIKRILLSRLFQVSINIFYSGENWLKIPVNTGFAYPYLQSFGVLLVKNHSSLQDVMRFDCTSSGWTERERPTTKSKRNEKILAFFFWHLIRNSLNNVTVSQNKRLLIATIIRYLRRANFNDCKRSTTHTWPRSCGRIIQAN